MAEHADGSIIIDTEIDQKGFAADSAKLQNAIRSLNNKMESLGSGFKKAISGNANALGSFDSKSAALKNTISELEAKLENLGKKKIVSEDYKWLTAELQKAQNELIKLEERQEKLRSLGVAENSKQWQSLQYDIDLARRKISEYEGAQAEMKANGTAFRMGTSTEEYAQLESALASAKNRLAEMQTEVSRTNAQASGLIATMKNAPPLSERLKSALSGVANIADRINSTFHSIDSLIVNSVSHPFSSLNKNIGSVISGLGYIGKKSVQSFGKLVNGIKSGTNHMRQFAKSSNSGGAAVSSLGKKITGLGSMFKRMLLRKILMSVITGIKESFDNLAQYSNNVNTNLSALKSGLTQLKNSFTTAFAPILTVVTPILSTLINYISTALAYIGKLFAALSGAKTFTKATAIQEDYAASLDKTSGSAKEAQRQLAGFDKINKLNDDSSGGSGGGGGVSPSEMFEEVPIENDISDFAKRLKDAIKNADWKELGTLLGEKVNEIADSIKWSDIGEKIGKKINAGVQTSYYFLNTVNFTKIGEHIGELLNGALEGTDFTFVGGLLVEVFAAIPDLIIGCLTKLKWNIVSGKLSDLIMGIFAGATDWLNKYNWDDLGHQLRQKLKDLIGGIKYGDISDSLFTFLGTALRSSAQFLDGFFGDIGGDIKKWFDGEIKGENWQETADNLFSAIGEAFSDIGTWAKEHIVQPFIKGLIGEDSWTKMQQIKEKFQRIIDWLQKIFGIHSPSTVMAEQGGYIIEGLWKGITDKLKSARTWIKDHIFTPFIQGFKNAFGIHSPSTVMEEQGGFIIQGLWNGINEAWSSITTFFFEKLDGIKTTLSNAWDSMKTTASEKWNDLKTNISDAWDNIKTTASTKWDSIKSTLSTSWDGLKTTANTKWENLKTTISDKWGDIKTTASAKWDGIKTELSKKADSIKTMLDGKDWKSIGSNICSGIKNGINAGWSWLKTTVGNLANNLLESAKKTLGIHSPSRLFHDVIGLNIGYGIGEGVEDSEPSILKSVSGVADAIASEFENGTYSIGEISARDKFGNSLETFSDTITDNFTNLLDKLQAIAENVTFTTPVTASGCVIPAGVSRKRYYNENTSNEPSDAMTFATMKKAVAEVLTAHGGGSENINLTVELDGDVVYKTVVKRNRQNLKKTGVNALGY